MGYVGNEPDVGFTSFAQQTITGNGGTSYTLSHAVANGKEILLYINNIKQEEGSSKAYTASGTTLTLSEAISSSDSCYCVFLGKALQTTVAPDGSVTSAKLANANLEMPNTLDMNGNELILDADGDTSIEASTDDTIVIDTAGTEQMRVNSDGDLLIGKTARDQGVVGCQLRTDGIGAFTADGSSPFRVNRLTSHGAIINIQKGGTTMGTFGSESTGFVVDGENLHAGIRFAGTNWIPRRSSADIDNTIALGSTSLRFDDAFIKNGVTTGSDQNEKQNIESLTAKELNVAKKLSALFKTYKWKDAVAEKGDEARTHTGIIAQEIQSAFSAEGLDASNYGMFMSDTWTNEEGEEQTRLGVRYPELFSFIFSSIEARLTALEGN